MIYLDIAIVEAHNPAILAIADVSTYTSGKNIDSPFVEITPPGFDKIGLSFVPRSVNIFNTTTLKLTGPDNKPGTLPDGIYKIRYSIRPAYENYTEKSILRLTSLKERFDLAFLQSDPSCCSSHQEEKVRRKLDTIAFYIQYAISAAAICNDKLAMDLYRKAVKLLDKFNC